MEEEVPLGWRGLLGGVGRAAEIPGIMAGQDTWSLAGTVMPLHGPRLPKLPLVPWAHCRWQWAPVECCPKSEMYRGVKAVTSS